MPNCTLLNTPEDLAWLKDVHCKQDFPPRALSALLEGNEDAPIRAQFFELAMPSLNADPIATIVFDEARSEAAAIIDRKDIPQVVLVNDQEACRLFYSDGRYRMDGYSGMHSVADFATDLVRLTAHWRLFRSANVLRAGFLHSVPRNGP
jgi:hypothetical protein